MSERFGRQFGQQNDEGCHHPAKDYGQLVFLGEAHRFAATGHGVNDDQQPAEDDGEIQPPAQHGGEDDGRRIDRDAGGEPALQEEQPRAEEACFGIEAPAQKLVGSVDVQTPVHRQEYRRDDDQRQRHAEVILHEAEPVSGSPGREWRER